jgi:hypothetical protein
MTFSKSVFVVVLMVILALTAACGKVIEGGSSSSSGTCQLNIATEQSGAEVIIGDNNLGFGNVKMAQSFKPNTAFTFNSVQIKLKRVGATSSLSGWLNMYIQKDTNGSPNGADLAKKTQFDISAITSTAAQYYKFELDSTVSITKDSTTQTFTPYWVIVEPSYTPSSTNNITWMANNSDLYTSGAAKFYSGTAWIDTGLGSARDFIMKLGCN